MVGAVRGRKFGRWVSKIGVERATDRRVKRSGEAGLLPPAPSPLYPNALCSPAPSPLYPNALRSPAPSPLCPNVLRPPRHRPFVQMRFAPPRHRRFIQMRFAPPHHRRFIQMRFAPPRHRPLYPSALRSVEAGANEDLPKFVADQSGIPVSASLVVAWDTGRIMLLSVSGMDHVSAMGLLLADPNWSGRRTME